MSVVRERKIVAALPAVLSPLTVYEIRRANGKDWDVYVTDDKGQLIALRLALIKGAPGAGGQELLDAALAARLAAEHARDQALAAVTAVLSRIDNIAFISGGCADD
jgi:hypothetical protein